MACVAINQFARLPKISRSSASMNPKVILASQSALKGVPYKAGVSCLVMMN